MFRLLLLLFELSNILKALFEVSNNVLAVEFVEYAEKGIHGRLEVDLLSTSVLFSAQLSGSDVGVVQEKFAFECLLQLLQDFVLGIVVIAVTLH